MDAGFDLNPKLFAHTSKGALAMGVTAEFLAQTQGISRQEQDEFALRSHRLAAAAQADGEFRREMIPIWGRDEAGNRMLVDRDQCVRPDASLEALAALKPAFHARRGHRDGRQQFAAERRSRGPADHVGRKGRVARAQAAGPRAGHGGRRRRCRP